MTRITSHSSSSAATMSYEHSATNRFLGQVEVMSESRRALEERFEHVLGEHGAAISRLAYSYEAVAGIREELVREIALAIWRALPHFRGECSERTFVFRIAHNRGLTHVSMAQQSLDDLEEANELVDTRSHDPDEQLAQQNDGDDLPRQFNACPSLTGR